MAEIVNLRQARKRKARADKERVAAENRAAHGRTRSERERERRLAAQADRFVEGHRRDPAPDKA